MTSFLGENYFDQIEECIKTFRNQIVEEQNEICASEKKVINLSNLIFEKDPQKLLTSQMEVYLPNISEIDFLYTKDQEHDIFYNCNYELKRKQLATERKEEYNSYLKKNEKEFYSRKKAIELSVPPKSILECVDYQKGVARRKEEEAKFRNLNVAEPKFAENILKPDISAPRKIPTPPQMMKENVVPSTLPSESISSLNTVQPTPLQRCEPPYFMQRTGGGGDPVRDSLGNIITVRGYKAPNSLDYPQLSNTVSIDKKLSYREELKKQIEEKKRLEIMKREEYRRLEDQRAQRAEEQRKQMLLEYENELKKNNLLKEQRQMEHIKKLAEFQQKEKDRETKARKKMMQYPKEMASPKHREYSRESRRSSSPPIPSVQSKEILEKASSPSVAKALSEVKVENLFSSLAEIRKSIMKEKNNLQNNSKGSYEVSSRRTVNDMAEEFDV